MPLKVEFSDANNKYQYDGHAHAVPLAKGAKGKLYLGDRDSGSMVQIKHRKITKAVNCQTDMHGLSQEEGVKYLNVDPIDNNASCLELAYRFINSSLEKGENVLVFCHSGYGRSAAVVIYYLMKAGGDGMSLADAHRITDDVRMGLVQCNDPKAGFRKELMLKLVVEEKRLRKTVTASVDSFRSINYLDGKGNKSPRAAASANALQGGSAGGKGSPMTGLVVFVAFIAVLYGCLLMASGGK